MAKKNEKDKEIRVLHNNEYYLDKFVYDVYGSPNSWSGGPGLIVKGYADFSIELRKGFFDEEYEAKVIMGNSLSKDEKEKLVYFATSEYVSFSDLNKFSSEIKKIYHINWGGR